MMTACNLKVLKDYFLKDAIYKNIYYKRELWFTCVLKKIVARSLYSLSREQ